MAVPEPLQRQVKVTQLTDAEMRRIGRNAAAEADRMMRSLEGKGPSAARRSAKIAMAKVNAEMWAGYGDAVKIGIGDAVYESLDLSAVLDEEILRKAGISSSYWRTSLIATAQEGTNSVLSRKENGIGLSERVYRNAALSRGYIDRAIDSGLLLGKSAREIAKDVVGFIDPNVPGGASFAAMRLGRTEVLNAYHTTSVRNYDQNPWVEHVKWALSGSHPRPDECNEYAEDTHIRGGGPGVFSTADVPAKPHPNCLCYVDPVVVPMDQFVRDFHSGKYDQYIDEQMGCGRVA